MQYVTDENNRVLHIIKSEEEYNAERSTQFAWGCIQQALALGFIGLAVLGVGLFILGSMLVEALR